MTHISNKQAVAKTYSFYLYNLNRGDTSRVSPGPRRIDILEADVGAKIVSVFERPVVYLSTKQRPHFSDLFSGDRGLKDYLEACSLMISRDLLPEGIDEEEKQNHQYDSFEAIRLLTLSAAADFSAAVYTLALCYYDGRFVQKNIDKALELFEQEALKGNVLGQLNLARIYFDGLGVKKDQARGILWYEKAATQGLSIAQYELGDIYLTGLYGNKNYKQAYEWFFKAAEQDVSMAQYQLGYMYSRGLYVEQSYEKAFELYKKSAEQGDSLAQVALACMYLNGHHVYPNHKKAFEWFQKSADQGDPVGQYQLADMYMNGLHVKQSYEKAFKWYEKSAEQGEPLAQYRLGEMYLNGWYVQENNAKAYEWSKKSAEQGCAEGQFQLASMYTVGWHVEQSLEEAFKWIQRSAAQGHINAQTSLGSCYLYGRGTAKNLELAIQWYNKVVNKDPLAHHNLMLAQQELNVIKAAQKEAALKAGQAKVQEMFRVRFFEYIEAVKTHLGQYDELNTRWQKVKGKELKIKSWERIKELDAQVQKGEAITTQFMKEVADLVNAFPNALDEARATLEKVELKAKQKEARRSQQLERRASVKYDSVPVVDVIPTVAEPTISETRLVKERLVKEAEAKEKRKSITLERRLSRTLSRNSLQIDFQQKQAEEALKFQKKRQRKIEKLLKVYKEEELISAGIISAKPDGEPAKTYGRIASFQKEAQEIYEGHREFGHYTDSVKECMKDFAYMEDLKLFKKSHKFEKLKNGLGGLVGVNHLKPWQSMGCVIQAFRVTDAIPERIVFAWNKKEKKAYQVTLVDYHAGKA